MPAVWFVLSAGISCGQNVFLHAPCLTAVTMLGFLALLLRTWYQARCRNDDFFLEEEDGTAINRKRSGRKGVSKETGGITNSSGEGVGPYQGQEKDEVFLSGSGRSIISKPSGVLRVDCQYRYQYHAEI